MSAQLVLAALRAGADDFLDREASPEQMQSAIRSSLVKGADAKDRSRARIIGVLSALPSDSDQDFALNLAVRAAKQAAQPMVLYIDLSLPASQADVALGIKLEFGVPDAVREIARLDKALLESAIARDPQSGLFVMPLATSFQAEGAVLEAASFSALLQVLESIFPLIVIGYGPFSHQRALLEMVAAQFFVCCNQRFSSIRGTGELLRWLAESGIATPQLVIHELARGQTPAPADIRKSLNVAHSIDFTGSWGELAGHLNDGKPAALSQSRYSKTLDACLARLGLAAEPEPDVAARLRGWLRLNPQAAIP